MILRARTLKKINDYGRKSFIKELRKISTTLKGEQKTKITDIIIYIDILFETEIDMAREAVDIKIMYYESIRILNDINNENNNVVLEILLEIHYYNLNYIEKLRNIA